MSPAGDEVSEELMTVYQVQPFGLETKYTALSALSEAGESGRVAGI